MRNLKKTLVERYILPAALRYLGPRPDRVAELVFGTPNWWDALLRGIISERSRAQQLLARADTLFRHAEGNADLEGKIAVAAARLSDDRAEFRKRLRQSLYGTESWAKGVLGDTPNFAQLNAARGQADWDRMEGWAALHQFLGAMVPWLDPAVTGNDLEFRLSQLINHKRELRSVFHACLCTESRLPLRLGSIRLPDTHSFWPQLFEIFINEDYAFEAGTETPLIIDAGMHMGLATYYFKAKYPGARIIGFEPSPALREIVEENVRTCGFGDVRVEPFALHREHGRLQFCIDPKDTMAGSITAAGDDTIEVETRRLSPYLDRPVDYLKLDIEGAEGGVLAECSGKLTNVHHLFLEYHESHQPEQNSLPAILGILERAGFDFEVGKSHGFHLMSEHQPMAHVGKKSSAVVWAKNRTWPPAGVA